jgi:hypothetical protein
VGSCRLDMVLLGRLARPWLTAAATTSATTAAARRLGSGGYWRDRSDDIAGIASVEDPHHVALSVACRGAGTQARQSPQEAGHNRLNRLFWECHRFDGHASNPVRLTTVDPPSRVGPFAKGALK